MAALATAALAGRSLAQQPHPAFLDARAAISEIDSHDPEARIELLEGAYLRHMSDFDSRKAKMSPKDAAKEWLDIVNQAIALPHRSLNGSLGGVPPSPMGTLSTSLSVLPSPEAWPELKAIADKLPSSADRTALQLLAARLMGDDQAILTLCDEYDQQTKKDQSGYTMREPFTGSVRAGAMRRMGKLTMRYLIEHGLLGGGNRYNRSIAEELPPADAELAILKMLKEKQTSFDNRRDRLLARSLYLAHIKEFAEPKWELATGIDDETFVKAMLQRFGAEALTEQGADIGAPILIRYLASKGQMDLAAKFVQARSTLQIGTHEWGPLSNNADRFVEDLQKRFPTLDLWRLYASAAEAAGHAPEAANRLAAKLKESGVTRDLRVELLGLLIDLHKWSGDLKALAVDCDQATEMTKTDRSSDPAYDILDAALLTGDEVLIDKAAAHAMGQEFYTSGTFFDFLVNRGETAKLESLLLNYAQKNASKGNYLSEIARPLCEIYFRAGRAEDIVHLLTDFPDWQVDDVSQLDPDSKVYAAWAFEKTGRHELAMQALRNTMLRDGATVGACKLLNDVAGEQGLAIYDEAIRVHRFLAAPFVWKADLLLRLGKVAEADAAIQEAIKLNPCGAYAAREKLTDVRGAVLRKKGDEAGAKLCQQTAKAIGLASKASDMEGNGLMTLATANFKAAVLICPNDPQIESDFAACLEAQGRKEEAEVHRRRSFEEWATAFGENSRMYLGYLDPEESEKLRETLNGYIAKHPDDPRAYCARGTVLDDLGYAKEATPDFQKAVSLDPEFVSAWQALDGFATAGSLRPEAAEQTELKLLELSPGEEDRSLARTYEMSAIRDLGAAYRMLQASIDKYPVLGSQSIFPLHNLGTYSKRAAIPDMDYLNPTNRGVSRIFGWPLGDIAALYHRTNFPFE